MVCGSEKKYGEVAELVVGKKPAFHTPSPRVGGGLEITVVVVYFSIFFVEPHHQKLRGDKCLVQGLVRLQDHRGSQP